MTRQDKNKWVCIDSGSNQVILTSSCGIAEFLDAINAYLRTAQAGAQLVIAGRGRIGNARVLHVPDASANLISTRALNLSGAKVIFGATDPDDPTTLYCEIVCTRGINHPDETKIIRARLVNGLFWIRRTVMFDLLLRGGFTEREAQKFQMNRIEDEMVGQLSWHGAELRPDREYENGYETDGDWATPFKCW